MKRLGSGLLLLFLLLTATVALDAPPAGACSCIASTDAGAFERAHAVFVGTVAHYDAPEMPTATTDPAVWTFSVSRVYKGKVLAAQTVSSAVSGASCGLEIPHKGEYLVFAESDGGSSLQANLCGGTRSTAEGALDPALARAHAPTPMHDDVDAGDGGSDLLAAPVIASALVVGLGVALLVYQRRKDTAA
jgi:hypothetical protein